MRIPRSLAATALAALLWLGPMAAAAYVLPGDFLCRLVANGRKSTLRDASITFRVERDGADGPRVEEARWYIQRPDRLRQVWLREGKEEVFIVRGSQAWAGDANDQQPVDAGHNLLALLLMPGGADLDESAEWVRAGIASAGIDPNVTSLARWRQGFAYVIGGEAREATKPQLWLDKAAFAPVRLVWPTGTPAAELPAATPAPAAAATAGDANAAPADAGLAAVPCAQHEWRLSNYAAGLPRHVEEWHDGRRLYRAEAIHVLTNQRLSESLFEPGPPPAPPAPAPAPVRRPHGRRGRR